MAQANYVPGVYNSNLSQGQALPTVANVDYDGVPEGVLNTRENQPAVAAGPYIQPGIPQNWPGGSFAAP